MLEMDPRPDQNEGDSQDSLKQIAAGNDQMTLNTRAGVAHRGLRRVKTGIRIWIARRHKVRHLAEHEPPRRRHHELRN